MSHEHEYETEAGTAAERIAKVLGVKLNKRNPLASSLHGLATVLEARHAAKPLTESNDPSYGDGIDH
jgi:hypothetical protein